MRYTNNDIIFEWDADKNRANVIKHGIDFIDASHVFEDEHRIEIYDEVHSGNEDRYLAIGRVKGILTVVYTERKEIVRIITARKATRYERGLYYDR